MASTTYQAQAKNNLAKGLLLGLGVGLLAGAAHRHRDRDYHDHGVRECWWERRVRYDEYDERIVSRVKVCI